MVADTRKVVPCPNWVCFVELSEWLLVCMFAIRCTGLSAIPAEGGGDEVLTVVSGRGGNRSDRIASVNVRFILGWTGEQG
jgi:hypothetical protein